MRHSEESHWLMGSEFSRQDGKSTNQDQRGKPNEVYCYNQSLLPASGEYFGGAGKSLGLQKPQRLSVSRSFASMKKGSLRSANKEDF